MHTTEGAATRARWEVRWINPRTKKRETKDFGTDHQGAVELYTRVKMAGRKGTTLRCKNVGFPPPDKYADREQVIVTVNGRKMKGKRLTEPRQYIKIMGELNLRGIWYCPYCQQLRKFVYRRGFRLDGRFVPRPAMCCPMCDVAHDNWHVRRYNPMAATMEYREGVVKDPASQTDAAQRRRERRARQKARRQREGR